jgi:hypothetical protein
MVCAFNQLDDFEAIDPAKFGFDEKFISGLVLDEFTKHQLLDNFADYHNYLRKIYRTDDD